ncbi:MAG: glycosyltransferase family 4 protein [Campylobacterota bacterium]|nr:glycosyltransferase family 4 protein [Campylobacterota bacterium]
MESKHIAILDVDGKKLYDMALMEGLREYNDIKVHIYSDFTTQEVRGKEYYRKDSSLLRHLWDTFRTMRDAKKHGVKLLITYIKQLNLKTMITVVMAKLYRLKSLGIEHDIAPLVEGKARVLHRLVHNYLLDHIVVHNHTAYDQLMEHISHSKSSKLLYIKHGHYLDSIVKETPKELACHKMGLDKNRKYMVIMADVLSKYHGVDMLIEAMSHLGEGIDLIIAGRVIENEAFESHKRLIKELKLKEQILWMPDLSLEDQEMLIFASEVMVFPYDKSYSNDAILKAMSYSRAVIASDIMVHQELIQDRFNGLLFKGGDGKALVEVLQYFFEYKYLVNDLPREAFKLIRDNYSWKVTAQGYLKLI